MKAICPIITGGFHPLQSPRALLTVLLCLLSPVAAYAQWQVIQETDAISGVETPVAQIRNNEGYFLAIYRDSNDTIRARFALNDRLTLLDKGSCPTYQIDDRQPRNNSLDSRSCLLQPRVSEYILGTIENDQVVSRPLYELMNGSTINYRFRLEAGGYDQTSFSLMGSKRALIAVLGENLEVLPR